VPAAPVPPAPQGGGVGNALRNTNPWVLIGSVVIIVMILVLVVVIIKSSR
jgi:hypothetical protein